MYIILQFSECFLDLFLITIGEELRKKTNPKCYKFLKVLILKSR